MRFTRIGSLAGVGFAIFFFVGVAMLEIPENASRPGARRVVVG